MVIDSPPKQSGSIIFWDSENVAEGLNLPAEGSGESASRTFNGTHSIVEMSHVPSASTITLWLKEWTDIDPRSFITLRTTHRPASLNRTEYFYLLKTYEVGDFIQESLGLMVVAKKDAFHGDDPTKQIIGCDVELSPAPPSA